MSDCSGKCCAVFNFTRTPDELRERAEEPGNPRAAEDRFLADMLVELTPEQAQERALRFEITPPKGYTLEEWANQTGKLYTCNHWDEESRLCTVYEDRPRMCREYPYGGRCQHDCDCTFTMPTHVRTRFAAMRVEDEVRRST